MEKNPSSQSADKSRKDKDTTTGEEKKNVTASQPRTLLGALAAMRLAQGTDLESHDVERSSEKPQYSVLDENFRDIMCLDSRISREIDRSTDPAQLDERIPWSVPSDLLHAIFNMCIRRHLGAALMQYVEALRLRTDLSDVEKNYGLQRDVKMLIYELRKLVMIEKARIASRARQQEPNKRDDQEFDQTQKMLFEMLINAYTLHERYRKGSMSSLEGKVSKGIFKNIGHELFSTESIKVEKGNIKTTIEKLNDVATEMSSLLHKNIETLGSWTIYSREGIRWQMRDDMKQNVNEIAKLARGLQSTCKEHEKDKIEEAVREIVLQTLNLLDVSERLVQERDKADENRIQMEKRSRKYASARWAHLVQERHKADENRITMENWREAPLLKWSKQITHQCEQSPSSPVYRQSSVVRAIGGTTGGVAGSMGGAAGAVLGSMAGSMGGAAGGLGGAVASGVAGGRWNPFAKEEVETRPRPSVTSSSFTPMECVATPFSDPVYLKGGGGSSGGGGGGGGDDGDDGGGGGGGGGGGNGGGESSGGMPDRDRYHEYSRRYLDACRSLTDAINDLCRITSQINGIQNDCREMMNKLTIQGAILQCGQPTSALSYAECVDELLNQRESIVLLNNDRPMIRIEFFRTLRYIVSAVCKTCDLATQCGYLLTLLACDQEAAKVGVVDVQQLKKVVEAAQFTCYKMLQFEPAQAREEAVRLMKQLDDLSTALADAGNRSPNMKERIDDLATDVHQSIVELDITLHLDDIKSITTAIIRLLNSIKRVGVLAEDPDIVPIAANTSQDARERRHDVLNRAMSLNSKTSALVEQAKTQTNLGDDSRPISWENGSDVAREFEELLLAVRKNGRSAGFIEDEQGEGVKEGVPNTTEPLKKVK